jgi:hypothetical protein
VAVTGSEEAGEGGISDLAARLLESCADEGGELVGRDHPDLHPSGAAPEGLVAVAEDPVEDVTAAPEIDVAHLALALEDRAHHVREVLVEAQDLLELVEDEDHAPLAFDRQLGRELEEPLDRLVDVGPAPGALEPEAKRSVDRVDLDRRENTQSAKQVRGALDRVPRR